MKARTALAGEYSFIQLDAEVHAQLITDKWEHAMKGEVETTKAKIRNMPSCGIVSNAAGDLVSFGLVDPSGFLNHFWTDTRH
ncbi:hypothetical protein AAVH_22055 [Aphelenchoides avenae]|nr:hypothetical protein AAVH_22055 [Aphelenchus avenae]